MPRRCAILRSCGLGSIRLRSGSNIRCARATRWQSSRRSPEAEALIRVQLEDFDVGAELDHLTFGNHRIGGGARFIGLVRDMGGSDRVSALTLEHYPGMTQKKLAQMETQPERRWHLDADLRIHPHGRLDPGDPAV